MGNYISIKEIAKKLNVSVATAWNYAKREDFPKKIKFSHKCTRWEEKEVEKWIKKYILIKA